MTGPVPVAVVGMDCRFPGAPDTAAFWRLLLDGTAAARPVPSDRWVADPDMPSGAAHPVACIAGAGDFDHRFFGLSPHEAAAMDPQQRLLLQCTWRAVEDAGIAPSALAGSDTSVHVGLMSSEWGTLHLSDYRGMTVHRGSGNGYCMAANRISYHLDLKGPSIAVDTACSSSLVAVHLACTALRAGEVDTAIAAGVNLILTPALSIFYAQAGLAAPDGRCKPFAAAADGIGRGEGVGVVVLRRLDDAVRDGLPVHAVIEGGAVGSDGRSNGLTAPNRFAQAEVIRRACRQAGVEPADVHFVEGHGTGTRLGDMIEVRALGDLHRGRARPALLGSVKGNLGHLEGAAGIAALIKACLALDHRLLPPTPGGPENPELRLAEHGLRLAATATRLPGGDLRAGVSSFGLGGTNAHLVLSAPPRPRPGAGSPDDAVVLVVGAATGEALRANARALRDAVAAESPARVGQLAWSTTEVKAGYRHRAAVAGAGTGLLRELDALDAALTRAADPAPAQRRSAPRAALVFTGQGSQYPGMTRSLYRHCPPYRRHLDAASAALGELPGGTLTDLLLDPAAPDLTATGTAQPALFGVEYAMASTLLDLGLEPVALLGHSVGEFAAACVAGALTLEDAAGLVAMRAALMQALPGGGAMLAVRCSAERIGEVLGPDRGGLDVAALNGPRATVLAGEGAAMARAAAALTAAGVANSPLPVSHAFHSRLMRPVVEEFARAAGRVPARPLRIPLASTVRGDLLPAGTVLDAGYWAEQVCAPVRFAEAAEHLRAVAPTHVVEVGPRPVLLALLRDLAGPHTALACCPGADSTGTELAGVVAALYRDGFDPDWERWFEPAQRVRRRLPGYVFDDGTRFWFTADVAARGPVAGPQVPVEKSGVAPPRAPQAAKAPLADAVRAAITAVSGHEADALVPSARLADDLGFDSVMVMRLADALEPHLGGPNRLDLDELLPHLTTVGRLIAHIQDAAAAPAREGVLQ